MQSKAVLVLSTAFVFASASMVDAQISNVTMLPSRSSFGGDFAISQPKGEFANNVPNGYGFDLTGMFKVDPKGYFNIRADVGGVQYGRETQRVNFPNTGRVALDMKLITVSASAPSVRSSRFPTAGSVPTPTLR